MVIKKLGKWRISEAELQKKIDTAIQLGRDTPQETSASKFSFNRLSKKIRIDLPTGAVLFFPSENIKELQGASFEEIEQGKLIAQGTLLRWDKFDADYSIEGFIHGRYGTKEWMRELGRRGGQSTSEAKAAAARKNGRRGGRPRKPSEKPFTPVTIVFGHTRATVESFASAGLDILLVGQNAPLASNTLLDLSHRVTGANRIWQN